MIIYDRDLSSTQKELDERKKLEGQEKKDEEIPVAPRKNRFWLVVFSFSGECFYYYPALGVYYYVFRFPFKLRTAWSQPSQVSAEFWLITPFLC